MMMSHGRPPTPERKTMSQQITVSPIAGTASVRVSLEPELQDHIGRQLRVVYDGLLQEPVPDRFLRLLAALEQRQGDFS
jgi:Anti-sigma factor NepR